MSNNISDNSYDNDFLRYLNNEMSNRERHRFERELEKDPFDADAIEGFSQFESKYVIADIKYLTKTLNKPGNNRRWKVVFSVAASVLLLIVASIFLFIPNVEKTTSQKSEEIKNEKREEVKINTPALVDSSLFALTPVKIENTDSLKKLAIAMWKEKQKAKQLQRETIEPIQTLASQKVIVLNDQEQIVSDQVISNSKTKTVTGRVLSSVDNSPLPGATVVLKGSPKGTITDENGNYRIELPNNINLVLKVSFIGMNDLELNVSGNSADFALKPSELALEEVVVVGYETQKKSAIVGAIAKVKDDTQKESDKPTTTMSNRDFRKYVEKNVQYPSSVEKKKRENITVTFMVTSAGKLKYFNFEGSSNDAINAEITRVIANGPTWNPAVENGKSVDKLVEIQVTIKP